MKRFLSILGGLISLSLCGSCGDEVFPKPQAELRLEYEAAQYQVYDSNCAYHFDYNKQAHVIAEKDCAVEIQYPRMKAGIFITYKPIHSDLEALLRDAQKLTYEHVRKADDITEQPFVNPDDKVYGMFYTVSGDAASSSQFYLTDSTDHFITGSLYFSAKPNYDSILPAAVYVQKDIRKLMESFRWKN